MPEAEVVKQPTNGISPLHGPFRPLVTQARLDEPHSLVDIKNTHPLQRHMVVSRRMEPIDLGPGEERKDVEMLNHDVDYFIGQRDPHRLYDPDGKGYKPMPLHPIVFTNIRAHEQERVQEKLRSGDKR